MLRINEFDEIPRPSNHISIPITHGRGWPRCDRFQATLISWSITSDQSSQSTIFFLSLLARSCPGVQHLLKPLRFAYFPVCLRFWASWFAYALLTLCSRAAASRAWHRCNPSQEGSNPHQREQCHKPITSQVGPRVIHFTGSRGNTHQRVNATMLVEGCFSS